MPQFNTDCLDKIFEYLENDKFTLQRCLRVNRLWCEVSVRILWKCVWNYRTFIACLPNESKDILYKNKIIIPTPNFKLPLFNYISFIKILEIDSIITKILKNHQSITSRDLNYKKYIIAQEIFKLFVNQISSVRLLSLYSSTIVDIPNITLPSFSFVPGAIDCLKNLSELSCCSDIYPEFFNQLSQTCYNIQTLNIKFEKIISNGLTDLISVQQNLKYLKIVRHCDSDRDLTGITSSLMKHCNTLVELEIDGLRSSFEKLQYVTFSQLQILKLDGWLSYQLFIKFLENNGKNLKELYIGYIDGDYNLVDLSISTFCPNLSKLYFFKKWWIRT